MKKLMMDRFYHYYGGTGNNSSFYWVYRSTQPLKEKGNHRHHTAAIPRDHLTMRFFAALKAVRNNIVTWLGRNGKAGNKKAKKLPAW